MGKGDSLLCRRNSQRHPRSEIRREEPLNRLLVIPKISLVAGYRIYTFQPPALALFVRLGLVL